MYRSNRNKYLISLIFVLSLFVILTGCSNNSSSPVENEPYSVSGTVVNMNGEAVDGVKVATEEGTISDSTKNGGKWTLSNLKGETTIHLLETEGLPNSVTVSKNQEDVDFIQMQVSDITIDTNNIDKIITKLASEEYNGRLPGTDGNKETENYIKSYFNDLGLTRPEQLGDYTQEFKHDVISAENSTKIVLKEEDLEYKNVVDFTLQTGFNNSTINGETKAPVMLFKDFYKENKNPDGKILLTTREELKECEIDLSEVINNAVEQGTNIEGILVKTSGYENREYAYPMRGVVSAFHPEIDKSSYNGPNMPMVSYLRESVYNKIKDTYLKTNKELYMKAGFKFERDITSNNIIGYIPAVKETEENIIISAHFDHLGENYGETYNPGALDNASGTSAMMELARLLKNRSELPQKNIVFIGFNAEEQGTVGSKYYTENPIFPMDKTLQINLDMVGSADQSVPTEINTYEEDPSVSLKNKLYNIIDIGYNKNIKKTTGPASDNVYFGDRGITLAQFDAKYYHTPLDTSDRVDIDRMKIIIKAVYNYIINNAYQSSALSLNKMAA